MSPSPLLIVVSTIRDLSAKYGYPPSVRDIASTLHRSTSTIHKQIRKGVERGFLKQDEHRSRTLIVTEEGLGWLDGGL